jgi:hypothetical protein
MARRRKMDEVDEFLFRNFETMIAIYRTMMDRGVPPKDGRLIFLVLAEVERMEPNTDNEYKEATRRVLDREGRMEQ